MHVDMAPGVGTAMYGGKGPGLIALFVLCSFVACFRRSVVHPCQHASGTALANRNTWGLLHCFVFHAQHPRHLWELTHGLDRHVQQAAECSGAALGFGSTLGAAHHAFVTFFGTGISARRPAPLIRCPKLQPPPPVVSSVLLPPSLALSLRFHLLPWVAHR